MLTFVDSSWHVLAGFMIFLVGLAGASTQRKLFAVPLKRAVLLYLWHTAFCLFYFWYSKKNGADSIAYYLRSYEYDLGFKFGTAGVTYYVSFFTQGMNLSYGNVFLIFNLAGYIGLLSFASALQTVTANSRRDIKRFSILFLFLPGIHFWSSAIGKDAITFMGAGLITWAILDLRRRWPAIILSVVFFLVPRPHMAGVVLLSFCCALFFSSNVGSIKKTALLIVALPLSIISVQFGLSYAGLDDASNVSAINDYFERRQGYNLGGGSSVDIAGMPVPLRMLTYLFRPFFFDASGILGLVVSIENLMLVALFLAVAFRKKRTSSVLGSLEFYFLLIFVLISWFILSNTTANLGIAIRQKTMFLPMLIVLLFSVWKGAATQPIVKGQKS